MWKLLHRSDLTPTILFPSFPLHPFWTSKVLSFYRCVSAISANLASTSNQSCLISHCSLIKDFPIPAKNPCVIQNWTKGIRHCKTWPVRNSLRSTSEMPWVPRASMGLWVRFNDFSLSEILKNALGGNFPDCHQFRYLDLLLCRCADLAITWDLSLQIRNLPAF